MTTRPRSPTPRSTHWLLRRMDQAAVGVLSIAALVGLAGYWIAHGGFGGRLVEIDRAPVRTARFEVDINRADWPELAQLPGIGESLAQRIVEVRARQGPFADHDELRRVRGIGPRTLERIKPYLRPLAGHDVAER